MGRRKDVDPDLWLADIDRSTLFNLREYRIRKSNSKVSGWVGSTSHMVFVWIHCTDVQIHCTDILIECK